MGAADVDAQSQANAEMAAAKPRERQFQVVPMPGVFTRGRWKCCDYRDSADVIGEKEKEKKLSEVTAPEISALVVDSQVQTTQVQTSDSQLVTVTSVISAVSAEVITQNEMTPTKDEKEPTIKVTHVSESKLPHTPLNGTPKTSDSLTDRINQAQSEGYSDIPPISITQNHWYSRRESVKVSHSQPDIQQVSLVTSTVNSTPEESTVTTQVPTTTTTVSSTTTTVRTTASPTEGAPAEEESTDASNGSAVPTPNVAAIDNKIEQAMDLVKTHLTFAVREEVEVLRQTIADLEQKVASLTNENNILKQYITPENLPQVLAIAAQHQQQSRNTTNTAVLPELPPPKVPIATGAAGFCTSALATTLNNVVAEVRQEIQEISRSPSGN